jgi:ABC-type lipoprotein release transport system permease subunit
MQNAVYDMKHRFILTDVKQKTTHLTTTTYNPIEDEFTDKKIIASKSEIKDFLNMNFSHAYYDENDHSTYFFVIGVDKKNRVKNLYIFNYTN